MSSTAFALAGPSRTVLDGLTTGIIVGHFIAVVCIAISDQMMLKVMSMTFRSIGKFFRAVFEYMIGDLAKKRRLLMALLLAANTVASVAETAANDGGAGPAIAAVASTIWAILIYWLSAYVQDALEAAMEMLVPDGEERPPAYRPESRRSINGPRLLHLILYSVALAGAIFATEVFLAPLSASPFEAMDHVSYGLAFAAHASICLQLFQPRPPKRTAKSDAKKALEKARKAVESIVPEPLPTPTLAPVPTR